MFHIKVEQGQGSKAVISPTTIKRDWADATAEKHAYRCFPVTQANTIGWNISFTEDISFIWNGTVDTTDKTVEVLKGKDFCYTGRGQASVSFYTELTFHTDQNVSIFAINPVNYFNDEFETMSSVISTSFFDFPLPLAIRAKVPNKEITIKAGDPVATLIPLSLTMMNNSTIELVDYSDPDYKRRNAIQSYGEASAEISKSGKWADFYRNAVNEKNEKIGTHEAKVLNFFIKDQRK